MRVPFICASINGTSFYVPSHSIATNIASNETKYWYFQFWLNKKVALNVLKQTKANANDGRQTSENRSIGETKLKWLNHLSPQWWHLHWVKTLSMWSIMGLIQMLATVEPRFNEPLYNKVLGITNDILQPSQNYSKMYGTGPPYNEPRFNEILVITNTIRRPKRKIYLDITNYS